MNKGEITSKPIYKNALEAFLDDYSSNKKVYQQLINEPKANKSINYHLLEGIYIKYSKNLEKYMKENKSNLKLSGNKKFENIPIDLFIKESQVYKAAIIAELHNKYSSKEESISSLNKLFLTPLPDKPRSLLNTQQEKDEFQTAERLAVVMRTVEYTNALRNQGNQYYMMKKPERQQMIYIFKRATDIIQDWWKAKGKEGIFKRRKKEKANKIKKQKQISALKTMNDILSNKVNIIESILFRQMKRRKRKKKKKKNAITHQYHISFLSTYYKQKVRNINWEYKSKKYKSVNENSNKISKSSFTPKELIILLQKKIKAFLKFKQTQQDIKKRLVRIIKLKVEGNKGILIKAFMHWIFALYSPTDPNCLRFKLRQLSGNFIQLGYKKLLESLSKIFQRRLFPLFSNLRYKQTKLQGIDKLAALFKRNDNKFGMKMIRHNIVSNLLNKIILKRNKLNYLWKYFSIWNVMNLLIHLFISKSNSIISKGTQRYYLTQLIYNNNSNANHYDYYNADIIKSNYNAIATSNQLSFQKNIRYSSIKNVVIKETNLFPSCKGLEYFSFILLKHYFKKLKECYMSSKGHDIAPSINEIDKRSMTYENNNISNPLFTNEYKPNPNTHPNLVLLHKDNKKSNNDNEESNHLPKKSKVKVKSIKRFDSMEKLENESESNLFKLKQPQEKEKENILSCSCLTYKIPSDSSGMNIDSSISHYRPNNTNKQSKNNTIKQ